MVEYLSNVEARLTARRSGNTLRAVEDEIVQEKANVLGRAGMRLEEALEALKRARDSLSEIERRLQRCEDHSEEANLLREAHSKSVVDLAALRKRVDLAYQFLIIQREAIGVCDHVDVERCYRITERL